MHKLRYAILITIGAALVAAGCGDSSDGDGPDTSRSSKAKSAEQSRAAAKKADEATGEAEFVLERTGDPTPEGERLDETGLFDDIVDAVNNEIQLPEDVTVVLGGSEDGPYYDPNNATIQFPWEFLDLERELLETQEYTGKDLDEAVADATTYILAHEIAHALIGQLELPVLGKEEDAADTFASFFAVVVLEDPDMAIPASDLFNAFDESAGNSAFDEAEFFDSHSLDAQRFYSISCQVYGSDPEELENIIDGLEFDEDRLAECPEEWDQIEASWYQLLEPHLREA